MEDDSLLRVPSAVPKARQRRSIVFFFCALLLVALAKMKRGSPHLVAAAHHARPTDFSDAPRFAPTRLTALTAASSSLLSYS